LPTLEVAPPRLWRKNRMMSGGRHIIDSGFHYCDTLRYLLGDVEKVYAEAREFAFGKPRKLQEEVEDAVFATFTFKNGTVGTWCFGLILPGEVTATSIFYCSQGSLRDLAEHRFRVFHLFRAGDMAGESANARITKADGTQVPFADIEKSYLESLSAEDREFLYPHGVMDGFAYEIWEFIEVVRGNRAKVEVDAREGMRSLAICEAVYESAYSGEAVRVDDVLEGKISAYQEKIDAYWGL
jgi:UDP-N-acetyl-2-amino-2-deoxyglucuronate dehydrogenase